MHKNSLKILFLTPLLKIGGEELSTLSLAKEMAKRGHEVHVYGDKGPLSHEFRNSGVKVVHSCKPFQRTLRGLINDARNLKIVIERHHIDIVHSQSVLPTISCYLAQKLLKGKKVPRLIFHERGIHEYSYPIICRLFNHMTDFVIANSDFERTKLIRNGLKSSHCIRVHNCINLDFPTKTKLIGNRSEFGISDDDIVIGTVGRLVKEKGIQFLLEAHKSICESYDNTMLMIVGDGHMRGFLEEKSLSLGINNRVLFTGRRRDMERIYPMFDIFVLASIWEPLGNVALEAAAFGKPVILSQVGGLPETMARGETGLLIPPADVGHLTSALRYLIENPKRTMEMGCKGRNWVRKYFSPHRVGNQVEEIYKALSS